MAEKTQTTTKQEETPRAIAKGMNLRISFKHSVEIGRAVKGRDVSYCIMYLTDVINKKKAIPVRRYGRDTSHKPGISAGSYFSKASTEILRTINSAIANAGSNHMDVERLYISKFECGRAISKRMSSMRGIGRLTNILVELMEREEKKPEKPQEPKKPQEKPEKQVKEVVLEHKKPKKEKKAKPKGKKRAKMGKNGDKK